VVTFNAYSLPDRSMVRGILRPDTGKTNQGKRVFTPSTSKALVDQQLDLVDLSAPNIVAIS